MPRAPKQYRIQAKNIFLTYPHCSLSKEEALNQLQAIQCPSNKKFIRISRELHENGEPHLHVLIQFEGKVQLSNPRHFDLRNPNASRDFHPNMQGAKSSTDVKSYIEKDGDYLDWGEFQIDGRSARGGQQTANDACAEALNTGNTEAALAVIREKLPKEFIFQHHNLVTNLKCIFTPLKTQYIPKYTHNQFVLNDDILDWLEEFFEFIPDLNSPAGPGFYKLKEGVERPKSLILEGESRTGKTQWARSLSPKHNYIAGHLNFSLDTYSDDVSYNVIDDIEPQYLKMKHWKHLIGAQKEWQTNLKYGKPRVIKGGIPSIIICNPGPESSYESFLNKPENEALKSWTLQNSTFTRIDGPPFNYQSDIEAEEDQTTL
uniref:Replication-associated protein n=1 Tax=Sesame curly top virus TaxID=2487726 RepID=A0A7D6BWY6_9GEMI|nr:replication-associated protein [Sesame curly top virus]